MKKKIKLSSPHDKYFKQLFTQIPEAKDFIINALPQIGKRIDIDSLELDNTSYINKELYDSTSDIVYNCTYKNKKIKIALLFEHKSQIDTLPFLQLLTYILNIWKTNYKQEKKIIPVIPILFYHGKNDYEFKTFDKYFDEFDEFLEPYTPLFKFELINTKDFTDTQINEMFELLSLRLAITVMKHIFDSQEDFLEILESNKKVFKQLQQISNGNDIIITLKKYIFNTKKITKGEFIMKYQNFFEGVAVVEDSIADRYINMGRVEGIERGRVEGIEKGIEKGIENEKYETVQKSIIAGLSNKTIRIITGLSFVEIDLIREKLELI